MNNGRVYLNDNTIYNKDSMFYEQNSLFDNFAQNATKSIIMPSKLSSVFFSRQNVDYIQNRIIQEVYRISNGKHKIGRQSDTELAIIMRSIYLQFSKNNDTDIRPQIRELDEMVVDECVPIVLNAVEQYIKYKYDVSNLQVPIDLPESQTNKGDKSLEYKPWF
jgi:hypothetical protein